VADFERRGIVQTMEHPTVGPFKTPGWPVRFGGCTPEVNPALLLGQHTNEVLREWLGLGVDQIEQLGRDGVMAELTGSEILARSLKNEGTDILFFLMGGPMLLAESACIKEGIRRLDVRHEQSAAFMGQAYSRLLQKPSACMAASGPGVTSFIVDAIHARCAGLHQCLDFAKVRCTWQSIRIGITAETRSVRTLLVGRVDVAGHGSKRGRSSSCKLDLTRLPHARKVSYFPRWLLVADLAAVKVRAFSLFHTS
jgi:hypothetical protein